MNHGRTDTFWIFKASTQFKSVIFKSLLNISEYWSLHPMSVFGLGWLED